MSLARQNLRQVRGAYFARREAVTATAWAPLVSTLFPSDQESEEYRFLGESPQLRQWVGGRQANRLLDEGVTIKNVTYEATLEETADNVRRNKTGQLRIRIEELATSLVEHWHKMITDELTENNTSYDGQAFFSASHSSGESGTQKNLLTASEVAALNVTTATAPTPQQMKDAILGVIAHMVGIKDDRGEPMNGSARNFAIMVPTGLMTATMQAINQQTLQGSGGGAIDNVLARGVGGYDVRMIVNPRLTSGTVFYVFRTDSAVRPIILQEELIEDLEVRDDVFDNNRWLFGVKAVRGRGPGYWQYASHSTLS